MYTNAKSLEAATRQICTDLVKATLGIDCTPDVLLFLKLVVSPEPGDLMKALEQVIRRIRASASAGRWMYPGNDIIFSVRDRGTPAVDVVVAGGITRADLDPGVIEAVGAAVAAAVSEPMRIVLDDERPPAGESGPVMRPRRQPHGLPNTDVLRTRLVDQWGVFYKHRDIAALTILLQVPAFFREAFSGGATTPRAVLEKERRAIQAACRAVDIKRSSKGRPRTEKRAAAPKGER